MKKFIRILVVFLACSAVLFAALGTILPTALAAPQQESNQHNHGDLSVTITGINTPVLEPDTDLVMSVKLANRTKHSIEVNTVSLGVSHGTFVASSHMRSWMAGNTRADVIKTVEVAAAIPAGKSTTVTITVPAAETPWPTSYFEWGPRGLEATADTDAGDFSDRSLFVVGPDAELTPTNLSIVAPVTATPATLAAQPTFAQILGARPSDDAAAELAEQSKRSLKQWDLPGVTFAVDPAFSVLAGLNAADFAALKKAKVALLPELDVDLAALAHTDRAKKISKFVNYSAKNLASYRAELDKVVFLPAGPVDNNVLVQAYAANMLPIISSADVPPDRILSYTPHAHGLVSVDGESRPALFADATLADAARGILGTPDSNLAPIKLTDFDARQALIALSAAHFRQLPNSPRGSILTLPRGQLLPDLTDGAAQSETTVELLKTVKALSAAPWVNPVSLAQLAATTPDETRRQQLPDERVAKSEITAAQINRVEKSAAGFLNLLQIFPDHEELLATGQQLADSFFSASWLTDPASRTQKIGQLETPSELDTFIRVEDSSTINMISETSALPLQITNPFSHPANVQVKIKTSDVRLQSNGAVTATLPAGTTKTVSVPVTAHGSGNMEVEAFVLNDSGTQVGASQRIPVRVRADWENTGTIIFAALVFSVLIFGVIKSVRAGRRSNPVALEDFTQARSDLHPDRES